MTLTSTPGAGTTVRVELPLPRGRAEDLPAVAEGPGGAGGRRALPTREAARAEGSLLLLVEDNPVNQRVLVGQLEAVGFRVDAAADAQEALRRFDEERYALVFTDIQLPHVDGYELARRLRAVEARTGREPVPILALTASALRGERERCRAAGMDDVVTKPTTMGILASTLRRRLPDVAWPPPGPVPDGVPAGIRPALDADALSELVAGDAALGEQILELYLDTIRGDLDALRDALRDGDREALRRRAHQVAGASRSVGAHEVAAIAAQLEEVAPDRGHGEEQLARLVHDLADALVAVTAARA